MHKPRSRQDRVVGEQVQDNYVLYDSDSKRAHHLNSTLLWLWKRCDGSRTIDELATEMHQELGYADAPHLLAIGLNQLADADLLEPGCIDPNYFGRDGLTLSRRAVIGGASIVAPVITSIVAPTPASSKSKPDVDKEPKFKGK